MRSALFAAALLAAIPASAQTYSCQTLGAFQNCTGSNGYSSTQTQLGGFTFGSDNQGNSWNSEQFGGQTFTNVTPGFNN